MKRLALLGFLGFGALTGCSLAPPPPQPVYVAPAPTYVAPAPIVTERRVVKRRYYRHGKRYVKHHRVKHRKM